MFCVEFHETGGLLSIFWEDTDMVGVKLSDEEKAFYMRLGRRLRDVRLEKEITQGELAYEIGIAPQQLQKYEYGQNRISIPKLKIAAEVLDTPFEYFTEVKPRQF